MVKLKDFDIQLSGFYNTVYLNNVKEFDKMTGFIVKQLEYDFFLMGGDLFESFEPYKLVNRDYARDAEDLWYRFKKAVDEQKGSELLNEFKVALTEIISNNSSC